MRGRMKEITIVLNILEGCNGEILERTRTHIIRKTDTGAVEGEFLNTTMEESAVKLTFTGLTSKCEFIITTTGRDIEKTEERKKANSAGILEFKTIVPAIGRVTLMEAVMS